MEPYSIDEVLRNTAGAGPELILCATAVLVIALDWFLSPRQSRAGAGAFALIGTLGALMVALDRNDAGGTVSFLFRDMLIYDGLSAMFRIFFLAATIVGIVFALRAESLKGRRMGEYYAAMLTATLGMIWLAAAADWMMFYIALETLSLPSYALAGYLRTDRRSSEAALKYVLYGGVASAMLLFGVSYLYGLSGTLEMSRAFQNAQAGLHAHAVALILVLCGLLFKIAAVPFQFWAPDVYQGAPTPVTAWLSVASKAAGFAALLRVFAPFITEAETVGPVASLISLPWLFWILSAFTMTFGNLAAIKQTDLKRLFAYSSIAHAGYLLMALAIFDSADAIRALLFYLLIYFVMNYGAFYCILVIENRTGRTDIAAFRGILALDSSARVSPILVVAMIACLLSLTGLPVLAGFIAKFLLFGALIERGSALTVSLALIGVLNSVISLYYYFRIARAMTLEKADAAVGVGDYRIPAFDRAVLWGVSVALVWLFIAWSGLLRIAEAGRMIGS